MARRAADLRRARVLAFAVRRERDARADGDDGAEAYDAVVTFIRG